MPKVVIKSKINDFIKEKLIEWKGKTLSSNQQFQDELEGTLVQVALFTIRTIEKRS